MMKFIQRDITGIKEILKTRDFEAIAVMVDDADVAAVNGKKVVPAGTIVGGKAKPVLQNDDQPVVTKNTALLGEDAEGVLLYDVDVTHGPRNGSMVIRGNIDLGKVEAPIAEAEAALKSRVLFIK